MEVGAELAESFESAAMEIPGQGCIFGAFCQQLLRAYFTLRYSHASVKKENLAREMPATRVGRSPSLKVNMNGRYSITGYSSKQNRSNALH